jgi:cell division protein FtsN
MSKAWLAAAAAAVALVALPARADDDRVKAGVDAWARGDYAGAVELWRGPADAGDPDAEFNLGQAYKLGRGVAADLNQAEKYYRLAAQQNHPQAQDNYGLALFQNGKHAEAAPWLQRSAERGEPRAQFVLGTMYFNGDGVPKDWVRAYAWMIRATASGLPQAAQTQSQMDRYIPLADRQQGQELANHLEGQGNQPQAPAEVASNDHGANHPRSSIGTTELPPSTAYHAPGDEAELIPPPSAAPQTQSATPESRGVRQTPVPGPGTLPPPPPVRIAAATPAARPAVPAPKAAAAPAPAPQPARVAPGGWQVQLGAFGDPGNARKLWTQVGARFPGHSPAYVKTGALTKVLVGPYANRADAAHACAGVSPCVPVAP